MFSGFAECFIRLAAADILCRRFRSVSTAKPHQTRVPFFIWLFKSLHHDRRSACPSSWTSHSVHSFQKKGGKSEQLQMTCLHPPGEASQSTLFPFPVCAALKPICVNRWCFNVVLNLFFGGRSTSIFITSAVSSKSEKVVGGWKWLEAQVTARRRRKLWTIQRIWNCVHILSF